MLLLLRNGKHKYDKYHKILFMKLRDNFQAESIKNNSDTFGGFSFSFFRFTENWEKASLSKYAGRGRGVQWLIERVSITKIASFNFDKKKINCFKKGEHFSTKKSINVPIVLFHPKFSI